MSASFQVPREALIPKGSRVAVYESANAIVAKYDNANGKPSAMGFVGKSNKPAFRYRFSSEGQRAEYIREFLNAQSERQARKVAARAERSKPHTLKVGQVLVCSWGYDQTNIDYYEVTRVVGPNSVEIREIESMVGAQSGHASSDLMVPRVGKYRSEPMLKRANSTNSVRISSYSSAYPWNGEAKHQTGFGYGH